MKPWLETYMFKNERERSLKAEQIMQWLADHYDFLSHARHALGDELNEKGFRVSQSQDDQTIQDLVLSEFHAIANAFSGTPVIKIVENHLGRTFIKQQVSSAAPPAVELTLEGLWIR